MAKMYLVKLSKKERAKRKERRRVKLDEAHSNGYAKGIQAATRNVRDEMTAALFTLLCRDPGQVTGTVEFEKSLIGRVDIRAKGSPDGSKIIYEVWAKDMSP